MTRPAGIGYEVRETLDNGRAYDCNLCPESSADLDLARAHHAVHVSGPDMLEALRAIETVAGIFENCDGKTTDVEELQDDLKSLRVIASKAVANAKTKKES